MLISPVRLIRIGLPAEDVCALYGLTEEELDLLLETECDRRRAIQQERPAAGRRLRTCCSPLKRSASREGR